MDETPTQEPLGSSLHPMEVSTQRTSAGFWSGLEPRGRAQVLVTAIGFLGTAGVGSVVVAYINQETELALARDKQQHEVEMSTRESDRQMRNDFLTSLRDSRQDLADRVDVLTFYSAVLREDDPLAVWAKDLLSKTLEEQASMSELHEELEGAQAAVNKAPTADAKVTATKKLNKVLAKTSAKIKRQQPARPIVSMGAASVAGRLAPGVIQGIVSQREGRFQACYGQGLAGDGELKGRVQVRFVIGRDGAVSNVSNAGSDLPDAGVVSCVISAFYGMSFPKPEGGIVTVVVPILLSPG